MRSPYLEKSFPKLRKGRYEITSPIDIAYNCFAWAAGEDSIVIDPYRSYSWPSGIPREQSLKVFIMLFESKGYKVCSSSKLEQGFEKVAIFIDNTYIPQHAARQLASGDWTSKLGDAEDIKHRLTDLEGKIYGKVAKVLKRYKH